MRQMSGFEHPARWRIDRTSSARTTSTHGGIPKKIHVQVTALAVAAPPEIIPEQRAEVRRKLGRCMPGLRLQQPYQPGGPALACEAQYGDTRPMHEKGRP